MEHEWTRERLRRVLAGEREVTRLELEDATLVQRDPTLRSSEREVARLREALEAKRAEVAELEQEIDTLSLPIGSPQWVRECAVTSKDVTGCSHLEPPQEVLDEMVRCGVVKVDMPEFLYGADGEIPDGWLADAGLADDELTAVREAARDFQEEFHSDFIAIAEQVGLSADVAGDMPWYALYPWLQAELADETWTAIQSQIARERAGHVERSSPESWSLYERLYRQHVESGDRFEARIAEVIGPERARELRRMKDGWGTKVAFGGTQCAEAP